MFAVASKATVPSGSTIRPASGRSRPAIARSVSDFPEPEAPISATSSSPAVNDGLSWNAPTRAAMSTLNIVEGRMRRMCGDEPEQHQQTRRRDDENDGQRDRHV